MLKSNLLYLLFLSSFIFITKTSNAQFTLSGTISDSATEAPIASANILLKGSTKARFHTNEKGYFKSNKLPEGEYTLSISYLGYQTKEKHFFLDRNINLKINMRKIPLLIEPLEITGTRAGKNAPFTKTTISAEELSQKNLGQDLPYLLKDQPSLLVTSDAGAGVGYTNMWIRGSDISRINITFNGIPVNDAESQGAFFVDIPDISSSANSIQIQRGVGTSTNGAGAFGATINIGTNAFHPNPYGKVSATYGSFNTQRYKVEAGTGLLNDHFTVDARLSYVSSDGFIDRASSKLKSYYLSAAYFNDNTSIRFNVFSGKETTYQAWNGVPEDSIKAGNRTYNGLGLMPNGEYYDNQIDHYTQTYYQLFWNQEINNRWNFNIAGFLTRGKGYYEEYEMNQKYSEYGLSTPVINNDTIHQTDLVRTRWLDNYYYGTIFSLNYNTPSFQSTFGGGWNSYDGKHYGHIVWARYGIDKGYEYYFNDAYKKDFNIYWKGSKNIVKGLSAFLDLQYRHISYKINGFAAHPDISQNNQYDFFNPKVGLNYRVNLQDHFYASYAIAHKAPNRDDYEINIKNTPVPEKLSDLEVGYDRNGDFYHLHANIYYMKYKNQLALTGEINYEGAYTRTNVPNSYRFGAEINGSVDFGKIFNFSANLALSKNKIKNFSTFIDNFDKGGQKKITLGETPISFSPQVISGGALTAKPFQNFAITLTGKYVGKRFLDNTGNDQRSLDSYFTNGLRLNYAFHPKGMKAVNLNLLINNLFDVNYATNGYTYAFFQGGEIQSTNAYYPQAGINFLFGVDVSF